jgi:hypothetical protein
MLWFVWFFMFEACEEFVDISGHGYIEGSVVIVPF